MELFQNHFKFPNPSFILRTINNVHDKERKNELVKMFKTGLSDLKTKLKRYLEMEKELNIQIEW